MMWWIQPVVRPLMSAWISLPSADLPSGVLVLPLPMVAPVSVWGQSGSLLAVAVAVT